MMPFPHDARPAYRETHTYAWRRLAKALRHFVLTFRRELLASLGGRRG